MFCIVLGPWRKLPGMAQMGPVISFTANPDFADILGDLDLDFDNVHCLISLDPKVPDFQV